MYKAIFAALAISAALIVSPAALAQGRSSEPRVPTLTVTAEGAVETAPDLATISLGVATVNADAATAMAENAERMTALVQTIRRAGVASRDIQTARLNLQPRHRRSSNGEEPVVTGYTASNQMQVRVRDLEALPRLIDASIRAGGNTLNNVSFSLEADAAPRDAARREAVAEARRRAGLYAEAAGLRVLRIVSMSEGYAPSHGGGDEIIVTGSRVNDAGAFQTPIESGEIQTRSIMTVVFELQ